MDPGEFRQGRLPLALMLNEKLGPTEDLIAISRVTDDLYPRWLVITPERVLLLNERYITTLQDTVIEFKRNEISELKARRYLVRSRIAFKVGGERKQLKVLGRDSARKLLEHLSDGSGS